MGGPQMSGEMMALTEPQTALVAAIGFLTRVHAAVPFQLAGIGEALTTVAALEWSFNSVHVAHMTFEFAMLPKMTTA